MVRDPEQGGADIGNIILVKRPGLYRTLGKADQRRLLYDPSSLGILLEEAIATGASGFAFTATSPARDEIPLLPKHVRRQTRVVDEKGVVAKSVQALLDPVRLEIGGQFRSNGTFWAPNGTAPDVVEALGVVYPQLYDFLLGSEFRLQIGVDLPKLRQAVATLRGVCKGQGAKHNLAEIEGILSTYAPHSISALAFRPGATAGRVELFADFVEDVTYQELSRATGLLGSAADGDHNARAIQRCVSHLSKMPLYKPVVVAAEKVLQFCYHLPLPIEALVKALLPRPHLPLIVPLDDAYRKAEREWKISRPPIESLPRADALLSDGWVEIPDSAQPTDADFQARPDTDTSL